MQKKIISRSVGEPVVALNKFAVYYCIGTRGAAKSSWIEWCAERHKFKGHRLVLDLWGARNEENMFWGINRKIRGRDWEPHPTHKCLVIVPFYLEVKVPDKWKDTYKFISNQTPLRDIMVMAKKEKRVIILNNSRFSYNESYITLAKLFRDMLDVNRDLSYNLFIITREAANLYSSLLLPCPEAKETRATGLQVLRECRHSNISMGLDSHIFGDVLKGMRESTDRIIIKKCKLGMLPEHLKYFPWKLKQERMKLKSKREGFSKFPDINYIHPGNFYAIMGDRFELYKFPPPTFRHKEEKDNFCKITGIEYVQDKDFLDMLGEFQNYRSADKKRFVSNMYKILNAIIHFQDELNYKNIDIGDIMDMSDVSVHKWPKYVKAFHQMIRTDPNVNIKDDSSPARKIV